MIECGTQMSIIIGALGLDKLTFWRSWPKSLLHYVGIQKAVSIIAIIVILSHFCTWYCLPDIIKCTNVTGILYFCMHFILIKTHGSESGGQEGTKHTPNKKKRNHYWSHLHDRTVSQFLKILYHILKSAWRNLRLTKGFTLHITGIKPLYWYYTPHKVSEQFVQLLIDQVDIIHTL